MSRTQELLATLTPQECESALKRAARLVDETPGTMQEVILTLAIRCARLEAAVEKEWK